MIEENTSLSRTEIKTNKSTKNVDYNFHFKIEISGDVKQGTCLRCTKRLKMKNSNTSGLRQHLKSCQPEFTIENTVLVKIKQKLPI